jgi:Family of unknown function (DUF6069)
VGCPNFGHGLDVTDMNHMIERTTVMPANSKTGRRAIVKAGIRAGLAAAVAAEACATIGRALDVPIKAGSIGASTAQQLPVGWFAVATIACAAAGTGFAVVLAGRRNPVRAFTATALVLTVLSFISPLAAGATTTATKVLLCIAHVVVAAIMIPALRRALAQAIHETPHEETPT